MHWYLDVLKKYADFSGRAGREEYWMFQLLNFAVSVIVGLVNMVFTGANSEAIPWLAVLYSIGTFLPSLAVVIRRLHDTNRSGWWYCIAFIPLLGALALLYFLISEGDVGDNDYGPSPIASNTSIADAGHNPAY